MDGVDPACQGCTPYPGVLPLAGVLTDGELARPVHELREITALIVYGEFREVDEVFYRR